MDKRKLKKLNILWVCSGTSCNNRDDPILHCKGIGESYIVAHDLILACLQSRVPIDAIYSSKFASAIETAEMIYRQMKKAEVKIQEDHKDSFNKHKKLFIESKGKKTRDEIDKEDLDKIAEEIEKSINKLPMKNLFGPFVKNRISILPFIGENDYTDSLKIFKELETSQFNSDIFNPDDIILESRYNEDIDVCGNSGRQCNSHIFECSPRYVPTLLKKIGEEMFFSPESKKNEYNIVIVTHSSFLREMFDLSVKSGQIVVQRDVFGQNIKGIGETPYLDSFIDIYSNDCDRCNIKGDEFLLENYGTIMVVRDDQKMQNEFHEEDWYKDMLKIPKLGKSVDRVEKLINE